MNTLKTFSLLAILFGILLQFNLAPRFQIIGDELLTNGDFRDGQQGWNLIGTSGQVEIAEGTATIKNNNLKPAFQLTQILPLPSVGRLILVQGNLQIKNVIGQDLSYQRARMYFVGLDSNGNYLWKNHHNVALMEGTLEWKRYDQVFPITAEMEKLAIAVGFSQSTGMLQVQNLSVRAVSERVIFKVVSYSMLAALAAVLMWISVPILRSMDRSPGSIGFFLITTAIIVAVLLPSPLKHRSHDIIVASGVIEYFRALLTLVTNVAHKLIPNDNPTNGLYLSKLGHLVFYTLLALSSVAAFPQSSVRVIFPNLLIFACVTEVLQFYAIGRSPSIRDWLIDSSGIVIGLLLDTMIRAYRTRHDTNVRNGYF